MRILPEGRFANAQTGNLVLLSVNLMEGEYAAALFFFSIIVIFGIGGGIGGIMSLRIGMKAVLVCPLILLLGCLYMK